MHHNLSQLGFHGSQNFTIQSRLNLYNSSSQMPKEKLQKIYHGKTTRRDNNSNIRDSCKKLTVQPCLKCDFKKQLANA